MRGTTFLFLCATALANNAFAATARVNADPSQAPAICAAPGSDSILVAHEDCTKFYKCYRGQPVAIDCPANLLYNAEKEYCDWPENVNCNRLSADKENEAMEEEEKQQENYENSDPGQAKAICAAEGSDGILVAHEECNKFYKCSEGKPAALDCPTNLLYNAEKEYCDWPENVNCNKLSADKEKGSMEEEEKQEENYGNSDPGQAKAICAAEGSDGILVAHEECNKFYKCSEGKPAALDCPTNLLYNAEKEYCDWPENVNCNRLSADKENEAMIEEEKQEEKQEENYVNSDPGQAKAICAAEGSDGILVAHEECNKFYKCSEGKPAALDCPTNLLYNAEKEYCDWPENVNCNKLSADKEKGSMEEEEKQEENYGNSDPGQAKAICAAEGSDGILVAHEECNKFYKCSEGKPAALDCPTNLLYNAEKEYCDWPENVNCNRLSADKENEAMIEEEKQEENYVNSDPGQAKAICAAEGSDGILVAHEECNKFYKCSEGKPAALDCPTNLLYNAEKEYCDWPENVNCNKLSADKEKESMEEEEKQEENYGNSDPGQAKAICAAEGSDGILVAHEECNKFYKCSEGKPAALDCPTNLLYNAEKEYCDWPENVQCEKKPADKETEKEDQDNSNHANSDEAAKICAVAGSDGVLIAHKECDKFYVCSQGSAITLECPLNLLFNPVQQLCDWPENVQC